MDITEHGKLLTTTSRFKKMVQQLAVSEDREVLLVYVALALTINGENLVEASDSEIANFVNEHERDRGSH